MPQINVGTDYGSQPLVCGHCDAPMIREGHLWRCSKKCRKAGRKDVRQWRTMAGHVINIKHMGESHLRAAIKYLERKGRTTSVGYQWLNEEFNRRGLMSLDAAPDELPLVAPPPPAAPLIEIKDEWDLEPPPKRGIKLKGPL